MPDVGLELTSPQIKSRRLYHLSQPGASRPSFKKINLNSFLLRTLKPHAAGWSCRSNCGLVPYLIAPETQFLLAWGEGTPVSFDPNT